MRSAPGTSAALKAYADAALNQAVSTMRPGWIVSRRAMLDVDGAWLPAQTQYALLHPQIGIALLDVVPGTTTTHAAERLRQRLDAAGFHGEFERNPPIRYLCIPLPAIHDLGRLLDEEFGGHCPAKLPHGAWVATAQRLLATELPSIPAEPASQRNADNQSLQCHVRGWQHPPVKPSPTRLSGGARWLGVFWGLLTITVSGGGVLLHYLGAPEISPSAVSAIQTEPVSGAGRGAGATALETPPERIPAGSADMLADNRELLPTPALPEIEPVKAAQTIGFAEAAPVRGPDAAAPTSGPTAMLTEIMVRRADALLQRGDVSGARLLYGRAAAAGSGGGALGMGKTYDAAFLAWIGVSGMGADPEAAVRWYRRAAALGDTEARDRLKAPTSPIGSTKSALEARP